jgi:hypothetical protein
MPQTEIAETTYTPQGWRQEPLRLIVRRVRIPVQELSEEPPQPAAADTHRGQSSDSALSCLTASLLQAVQ